MTPDSWLKISLPAFPVGFTIFGVWIYWGENPLALLPPPIAFWGLVVLFYLFSHFDVPGKRYPLFLMICITVLWFIASATSHGLSKFLSSSEYVGLGSVMTNKNFWYSYICAGISGALGLKHFLRLEPIIAAQVKRDRVADTLRTDS